MKASECDHHWLPIEGWTGRYRCSKCHAIGGRRRIISDGAKAGMHIVPYICKKQGCHEPAIAYDGTQQGKHEALAGRGPVQLCRRHREEAGLMGGVPRKGRRRRYGRSTAQ